MRVFLLRWNDRDRKWVPLTALVGREEGQSGRYKFVDVDTGLRYTVEVTR